METFINYSRRTDKYGFDRDIKFYEADLIQASEELGQLARTENENLKQIQYNPPWNYFKHLVRDELTSKKERAFLPNARWMSNLYLVG